MNQQIKLLKYYFLALVQIFDLTRRRVIFISEKAKFAAVCGRYGENLNEVRNKICLMEPRIQNMNKLVAGIFFLISCNNQLKEQHFTEKILPQPIVMSKNGAEIFQYWEFKNERYLWDTHAISPLSLKRYKDSINTILGENNLKLTLQKLALQDSYYKSVKTTNGDSINTQLIHAKVLGKIRPINFLESQLLGYQLNRYPLLSHPTEFHGFIVVNDSLNLVKVYFAASDQPWPPKPKVILEAITNDLNQGWKLKYHLHNHYEPKSNHYLGILAPSMTDAQYYLFLAEDFNLEHALVTNGFHTVDLQRAELSKLKTPGNK